MTKEKFPFIAALIGFILTVIVMKGSGLQADGQTFIPLLTLLLVSEFGAIVTAIGVFLGIKQFLATKKITVNTGVALACAMLSIHFIVLGLQLWPNSP